MAGIRARLSAQYVPLSGVAEQAAAIAEPRMDRLGERIVANARRRCPVRTGALRDSIGHRTMVSGSRVTLRVFADSRHARYVHEGTRPHVIEPRRAKALRFDWPRAGGTVFFARVHHPGYAGKKFLADAVHEELGHPI